MTGEVKIDTIDIWTTYGAFMLKESYNELLQPPKRKASLNNNWPEQNGLEIDLAAPKFEAKDADISFILSASNETEWWVRHNAFFTLLKAAGERTLYVKELEKTLSVYYKEVSAYDQITKVKGVNKVVARFTVKFGIANPAF